MRTARPTATLPLATALLATALLTACADDPPPPAPPDTPTAPATPRPTLPVLPEQALEFTDEGLSTFARHVVAVLDFAGRTGDTSDLQDLSRAECTGCAEYIRFFGDTYKRGGSIQQEWTAAKRNWVRFVDERNRESYVTVTIAITAGEFTPSSSAPATSTPASKEKVTLAAQFDGRWTVTQLWSGDFA